MLSIYLPDQDVALLLELRGWTRNVRGQHVSPDRDWSCWHADEALTTALSLEAAAHVAETA